MEGRLLAITSALLHRTTSVALDETLCLGVFLGLDDLGLAQPKPKTRMERLWGMIPRVPLSLVYEAGERLEIDGLRWAPRTFLWQVSNKKFTESPSNGPPIADMENLSIGAVTKRGMAMHMAGIIIYSGSALLGTFLFVRAIDEDGWYQVFF